ncbi:RNA-directed DNA polymerase (reverse transcriptase)-related family protein [Trifolium repens]|nr:RNA-directed DNA polymerase (reverse transcriptase)-related family protein [Trifolium repens]
MAEANNLRSRISQIHNFIKDEEESNPSDSQDLLRDCAIHVQNTVQQIVSEFSDIDSLQNHDFDAYVEYLKKELNEVEVESANVATEIEHLAKTRKDDSIHLEAKLEELECSLQYIISEEQMTVEANEGIVSRMLEDTVMNLDENLEQLELENKVDEMKAILKTMECLQCKVKWFDAIEQIGDALTGLKVLEFDENCIRLSLHTYMPTAESISCLQRVEDTNDASVLNHELLIEVFEGTMKLKDIQVFPNDIYVDDIVDTAKSVSKSPLQWLIEKLQDRIILSSLRRLVINDANKSRYSLEYLEKDETIVAHLVKGIDAYIKVSHGWPIFGSPLKLISIKGLDILKKNSASFHCEVKNLANSLDTHTRQNILGFVDAVENVLKEQLQLDPRAADGSG